MATIRKRKGKWQAQVRLLGNPSVSRTFTSRKDAYVPNLRVKDLFYQKTNKTLNYLQN